MMVILDKRGSPEEIKQKSEKLKGRISPKKGIKLSEEHMSKSRKGKPWSLVRRVAQERRNNESYKSK